MTLRKILIEPNEILRKKSLKVESVDTNVQKLMDDMLETMYAAPGIGLAAIQIGVPKRVIVLDIAQKDGPKNPMYFINPEIIQKSLNNLTYEEGCLSLPGQFAEIARPDKCSLKYLDYHGQSKELEVEGMLATCIQHEIDHLEGILFIDYLSKLKKSMIVKKLSKQKEQLDRIVI
jgi:peptide deformylase